MEKFFNKSKRQLDELGIFNNEISEATENKLSQKGYPKSFIAQNSKDVLEDLVEQKMSFAQFKKLATPARNVEKFEPITILPEQELESEQTSTNHRFFDEKKSDQINETDGGEFQYKEPVELDNSIFSGVGLEESFPEEHLN